VRSPASSPRSIRGEPRAWWRPRSYTNLARRNEGTGRRHGLAPAGADAVPRFAQGRQLRSRGRRRAGAHLMLYGGGPSLFERNRAAIVGAIEKTDWVDPGRASSSRGGAAYDDAWDARGRDFADKVKPEGWKGFEESLALARKDLEASWRERPDRPEAANKMIAVSLADRQPGESPRLWFDRSVAARSTTCRPMRTCSARSSCAGADPRRSRSLSLANVRRRGASTPRCRSRRTLQSRGWKATSGTWPPTTRTSRCCRTSATLALRERGGVHARRHRLERYRRDPARELEWRRFASLQAAIAYKGGRYERRASCCHELNGTLEQVARDGRGRGHGRGSDRGLCRPGRRPDAPRGAALHGGTRRRGAAALRESTREGAARGPGVSRQAARGDRAGGRSRGRARHPARAGQGASRVARGERQLDGRAGRRPSRHVRERVGS
jgi:hypothetical protein